NPQALCVDQQNRLWVGTLAEGISVIDPATGVTQSHYPLKRGGEKLLDQVPRVTVLEESEDGRMFAATSAGVVALGSDPSDDLLFEPDRTDPRSIYNSRIVAMQWDRSGILWVASYFGGISRIHHSPARFDQFIPDPMAAAGSAVNRIRGITARSIGEILAVNGESLYSIEAQSGLFRKSSLPKELAEREIMLTALYEDSRGTVWLGTERGLYRLSDDLELVAVYTNREQDPRSISSNAINVISEDRQGRIWIGTGRGLNRFSYDDQKFRQYVAGKESLRNDFILSIYADSKEKLWIGTYGGTSALDLQDGSFRHYVQKSNDPTGISSNYAHSFAETEDGVLWIGTGGGLNRLNREDGTFRHYFERDGLTNNVIAAIAASPDGNLWISTQNGITRLEPLSGSFTNLNGVQGLAGHMFTPAAGLTTTTGYIAFGGAHGVTMFHPSEISIRDYHPPVVFTDFSLFGGKGSLAAPVQSGDSLSFGYDENFFRVTFASLDFVNPQGNLYSFLLEGVDDTWSAWGKSREAVYTGLQPGAYRLRVRGTNGDGVQSPREATLRVTIEPPFWKTWWFYLALCFIGAGILVAVHRIRVRTRLRRADEIQQARLEEAESIRKRAARDFHDEFGHRLTKICLFAEIVKRQIGSTAPETAARIDKIIESSQALTDDTRNFLWTLDPAHDSLFELIGYLNRFGEELFDRTGILFRPASTVPSMKKVKLTMDFRRHLALILKEAMNNALRHSHGTMIDFSATVEGAEFQIALSDDGTGLLTEAGSAGNGMKNMRHRAQRINGAIHIASGPGRGTRVVFAANAA
ncbi:MAG: histidine kinase, partial [Ignavibacteria bacterium]|nr:histidine kinase [Ignavibacteria bacterium]